LLVPIIPKVGTWSRKGKETTSWLGGRRGRPFTRNGDVQDAQLRLLVSEGQVRVTCGRSLAYRFEVDDLGMRNLAIVALTDADRRVDEVAAAEPCAAARPRSIETYVTLTRTPGGFAAVAARPSCHSGRSPRPGPGRARG